MLVRLRQPWWSESWFRLLAPIVGIVLGAIILLLDRNGFQLRTVGVVVAILVAGIAVFVLPDLKRILLLGIALDLSVGMDVHLGCDETFFSTSCGLNISITTLCLLALYAIWLLESLRGAKRQQLKLGAVSLASCVFLVAALVSLLNATVMRYGINQVWLYATATLLLVYLANNLRSADDVIMLIYGLALGLFVQLIVMGLQFLGFVEITGASDRLRIYGTLRHPNIAGGYLFQIILLLSGMLLLRMNKWQKRLLMLLVGAALAALVLTQSRGAWMALLVGLAVMAVGGLWMRRISIASIGKIGLVLLVLLAPLSATVIERLTTDDRGAALARQPLQEIALSMVDEQPLIGVGINNFGVVLYDYLGPDQYGAWLYLVHNGWLLIWAEMGTFGLLAWSVLWFVAFWQSLQLMRSEHKIYGTLGLVFLAIFCGMSIYMLVEVSIRRELIFPLWMHFGLVQAMTNLARQERLGQFSFHGIKQIQSRYGEPAHSHQ